MPHTTRRKPNQPASPVKFMGLAPERKREMEYNINKKVLMDRARRVLNKLHGTDIPTLTQQEVYEILVMGVEDKQKQIYLERLGRARDWKEMTFESKESFMNIWNSHAKLEYRISIESAEATAREYVAADHEGCIRENHRTCYVPVGWNMKGEVGRCFGFHVIDHDKWQ